MVVSPRDGAVTGRGRLRRPATRLSRRVHIIEDNLDIAESDRGPGRHSGRAVDPITVHHRAVGRTQILDGDPFLVAQIRA
jgi:hypothetical protein